jgi:hypothetical protein
MQKYNTAMNENGRQLDVLPASGSTGTFIRTDAGIVISFPPRGVFRAFGGHFAFSLILALAGFTLLLMSVGKHENSILRLIWTALMTSGLYLLASTVHMGRQRTTVDAGKHGLSVENIGPLFSSSRSWPRSQISGITLSGYRSATVVVDGKNMRFPLDRGRADVWWLVTLVRQAMDMPPQQSVRPSPCRQSYDVPSNGRWN